MATFEQGDVVKVPFPYTDRSTRQSRPALVVSTPALSRAHGLLWVAMITSAANRGWTNDFAVADLRMAGLPVASVVRTAKIATIESAHATRLGTISQTQLSRVLRAIANVLAIRVARSP